MADVDFDDFDVAHDRAWARSRVDPARNPGRLARFIHLAGASCSTALVLGLCWWGYSLAVRDVTGVPVIRALEGPMRIAPENPGGEVFDHQGLSVNTVVALGAAAPSPDRLVLAPRPVELSPEDTAGLSATGPGPISTALAAPDPAPDASLPPAPAAPALSPLTTDVATAPQPATPNATPTETLGPDPDAVALALAEALALPDDALPAVAPADASAAAPSEGPLRPMPRPGTSAAAVAATDALQPPALAETAVTLPPGTPEVDAALIPAGTRLAQLGAFDTPDQARAEWLRLSNQFAPLLAGKALVIQAAESGGSTFYRLRAHGFADEVETRGFCSTLLQQNASCIPVEQR